MRKLFFVAALLFTTTALAREPRFQYIGEAGPVEFYGAVVDSDAVGPGEEKMVVQLVNNSDDAVTVYFSLSADCRYGTDQKPPSSWGVGLRPGQTKTGDWDMSHWARCTGGVVGFEITRIKVVAQ